MGMDDAFDRFNARVDARPALDAANPCGELEAARPPEHDPYVERPEEQPALRVKVSEAARRGPLRRPPAAIPDGPDVPAWAADEQLQLHPEDDDDEGPSVPGKSEAQAARDAIAAEAVFAKLHDYVAAEYDAAQPGQPGEGGVVRSVALVVVLVTASRLSGSSLMRKVFADAARDALATALRRRP